MPEKSAVEAWAIKAPSVGDLTAEAREFGVIGIAAIFYGVYAIYRCVRVRIEEVAE